MIQPPDGAAAPISMDKVGRRNYADNNRDASGAVGPSARTSTAVAAAITTGAACGWSNTARCPFRAQSGSPACPARRPARERKQGLGPRSRGGLRHRGAAPPVTRRGHARSRRRRSSRRAAVRGCCRSSFPRAAHVEAETGCSRQARALPWKRRLSGCSRPRANVGRTARVATRRSPARSLGGIGAYIMGVGCSAAADGHRTRRGWAGGETTRACMR